MPAPAPAPRSPLRSRGARALARAALARAALAALASSLPGLLAGCGAASVATASGPGATVLILAVPVAPDSAVRLTQRALGEVAGTVPSLQWSATEAVLATRLTKRRSGPGSGEITIAAIVARRLTPGPIPTDTMAGATTRVQLQAFAMDSVPQRVGRIDQSIHATETLLQRPRPVAQSDSVEWAPVQRVLDALHLAGARLVQWNGPGAPKRP